MFRHSPSRNNRSKGIRVKHVLQICLLLAVCFWLIYQVKHSHNRKKELDENDSKISLNTLSVDEISKLGRKNLHPQLQETVVKEEKHDEEEVEEEDNRGEDEDKQEDEEKEEDTKTEVKESESRGGGDDEIDENDQEKSDAEVDSEDNSIDEENEKEEGDEKESEENDSHVGNGDSSEDHDHDGVSRNNHEAREEHYKADDASSAVTHDIIFSSKNEIGSSQNSTENGEKDILEQENTIDETKGISISKKSTVLKVEDGEMAGNGTLSNATFSEKIGLEIVPFKSQNSSILNSTITTGSIDQPGQGDNSTEVSKGSHGLSLQNGNGTKSDSTQVQNFTLGGIPSKEDSSLQTIAHQPGNTSTIDSRNNQSDTDSTSSIATENVEATSGESSNSSTNSQVGVSERITSFSESVESEDRSDSLRTEVNIDATRNERSDTDNEMDGTDESSRHEHIDTTDPSILLEEAAQTDLDTLPEIQTEGSNSEDTAAE